MHAAPAGDADHSFFYDGKVVTPELRGAVASFDSPLAILDLDALNRNAAALTQRAHGLPIRVASKSLRVPEVLRHVLGLPGFAGILGFSLPEALALSAAGFSDIVVAYPTTHRAGIRELAQNPEACERITLMVDSAAHLDFLQAAVADIQAPPLRVCIDVDASLRLAEPILRDRLHIGARRSPVRTVDDALNLVAGIQARADAFQLVGVMSYEGQIAGSANAGASPRQAVLRRLQAASIAELKERRTAVIAAIRNEADLEFVNGGGTGSLEASAAEGSLTELAAGSGLFAPGLFDGYTHFQHEPAAYFATPVVRIPSPGWVTVFQGGWIASGPPGADRLPTIAWPAGLEYSAAEGPGEVQTPLHGPGAAALALGDHVFFRHAKSGELAEHVNEFHVYSNGQIIDRWATYRGKGWAF